MTFSVRLAGAVLLLVVATGSSHGFEAAAHRAFTRAAAEYSPGDFQSVPAALGIDLSWDTLRERMEDGAYDEDFLPTEAEVVSHFHEPITNMGLKGTAASSAAWAQARSKRSGWAAMLDSIASAFSGASIEERRVALSDAFYYLGRVSHLLQDSGSVSHVRDDIHLHKCVNVGSHALCNAPMARDHEFATEDRVLAAGISLLDYRQHLFERSALGLRSPISNLWDRNIYVDGACGAVTPAVAGLAELTAAHGLSEGTVLLDQGPDISLPCPRFSQEACAKLGTDAGPWRRRIRCKAEAPIAPQQAYFESWDAVILPSPSVRRTRALDRDAADQLTDWLIPRVKGATYWLLRYAVGGIRRPGNLGLPASDAMIFGVLPNRLARHRGEPWSFTVRSSQELDGRLHAFVEGDGRDRVRLTSKKGVAVKGKVVVVGGDVARRLYTEGPLDGTIAIYFRGKVGSDRDAIFGGIEVCKGGQKVGGGLEGFCNSCGNGEIDPPFQNSKYEECDPSEEWDETEVVAPLCEDAGGAKTPCCYPRLCRRSCAPRGDVKQCAYWQSAAPLCGDYAVDPGEACERNGDCPGQSYCLADECQCLPFGVCLGGGGQFCGQQGTMACSCQDTMTIEEAACVPDSWQPSDCVECSSECVTSGDCKELYGSRRPMACLRNNAGLGRCVETCNF